MFTSFVLSLSSKMEDYLGTIATYLYNIHKVLKTLPSSEKSLVRQGLSSASRRYFSYQSVPKKIQSGSTAVPFITGEDGQLFPGKLINSHSLILIHYYMHCIVDTQVSSFTLVMDCFRYSGPTTKISFRNHCSVGINLPLISQ